MTKILTAAKSTNEEIRKVAMQTLVEVARQEYDSLQFYFDEIFQLTSLLAIYDDQSVGAQAIEFWTSLAEEELGRRNKKQNVKSYISRRYILSFFFFCCCCCFVVC